MKINLKIYKQKLKDWPQAGLPIICQEAMIEALEEARAFIKKHHDCAEMEQNCPGCEWLERFEDD